MPEVVLNEPDEDTAHDVNIANSAGSSAASVASAITPRIEKRKADILDDDASDSGADGNKGEQEEKTV
jgi:hypothetical protein